MGMRWLGRRGGRSYTPREVQAVTLIAGGEPSTGRRWSKIADDVAAVFLRRQWAVVYCGMGDGLAGSIAMKVLAGGGNVTAIVVPEHSPPDLPARAVVVNAADFHERRRKLFDMSDGTLVLPGGSGTLSEYTDLIEWSGAGLYEKPLVVYDPDDWFAPIEAFYRDAYKRRATKFFMPHVIREEVSPARITTLMRSPR